jgi:hypothetical protein
MNMTTKIIIKLSRIFHTSFMLACNSARMKKTFHVKLLWCFPLCIYAADANAWGLYTHILFSQWMLVTSPLLDPKILRAIKKFPKLVMAGACLPDLAVISKSFHTTHQWEKAELMIKNANSEQEIAIAIGYTSHLFVDVVAHNHFVPAHEAKWMNESVVTHIASEWAMDAHIAKNIPHCPHHLILVHIDELSAFISPCFNVSTRHAKSKLRQLAWADGLLRVSQLSSIILLVLKLKDSELVKNFNYYLSKTSYALTHFEQSVQGNRPSWEPELNHLNAVEMVAWREKCLNELSARLATPIKLYHTKKAA